MHKTLFLFILVFSQLSLAQVVIIPEKSISLSDYLTKCRIEGYQCVHDYFKLTLDNQNSEAFDHFLETIDLYNEDYRKIFFDRIKTLLAEENISVLQAELLLKVIKKYESIEKSPSVLEIRNEITDLLTDLRQMPDEKSDTESYFIFKKIISKKQYAQLKYKIKYTRVIRITPYTEPTPANNLNPTYLIGGTCDSPTVSALVEGFKSVHYVPMFTDPCSSTAFSETKVEWVQYQKPVLYTLAAAAAIFLLSSYELKIEY